MAEVESVGRVDDAPERYNVDDRLGPFGEEGNWHDKPGKDGDGDVAQVGHTLAGDGPHYCDVEQCGESAAYEQGADHREDERGAGGGGARQVHAEEEERQNQQRHGPQQRGRQAEGDGAREPQAVEKWLRKSEQGDKWNRCLIEGMIVLSETGARDEQTTPP